MGPHYSCSTSPWTLGQNLLSMSQLATSAVVRFIPNLTQNTWRSTTMHKILSAIPLARSLSNKMSENVHNPGFEVLRCPLSFGSIGILGCFQTPSGSRRKPDWMLVKAAFIMGFCRQFVEQPLSEAGTARSVYSYYGIHTRANNNRPCSICGS